MKKSILISTSVLLTLTALFNVYNSMPKIAFADLLFSKTEAIAASECGSYDFEGQLLDQAEAYCWDHKTNHQWMDCIDANDATKCCDSRLQTAKPTCL